MFTTTAVLHNTWFRKLPQHTQMGLLEKACFFSCMSTTCLRMFSLWIPMCLVYDSAQILHGMVAFLVNVRPCAISNACNHFKFISSLCPT